MKNVKKVEQGVSLILEALSDEFKFELDGNYTDTPQRVARAYWEIFSGLKDTDEQIDKVIQSKFDGEDYTGMIIQQGIKAFSMCPHHFLPVEYDIDIGYIPSKKGQVLGLSKLSRIALILARRPVLQEALTRDIGKALERTHPLGVMIKISGIHYCMRMRGAKQLARTITSYVSGVFESEVATRMEYMGLIREGK